MAPRRAGGVSRELVGGKWAVEVEPEQPRDVLERRSVCVWGRERREGAGWRRVGGLERGCMGGSACPTRLRKGHEC